MTKKVYQAPDLKVHGDIRAITRGNTAGLGIDGGSFLRNQSRDNTTGYNNGHGS